VKRDGLILLDKPAGPSSQDAVTLVKRALKADKAGHAGTLDPFATGLLLVCLGRATKLAGYLTGEDKEYLATVALGVATDTDDSTGRELSRADAAGLKRERLEEALQAFRGALQQVPPAYSAIQREGERMYRCARRGETVDIPPRPVTVHELTLIAFHPGSLAQADLRLKVSKGTYIRSLARDLGKALGLGGHLAGLRRTASGSYSLEEGSIALSALRERPESAPLVPLERIRLPMPSHRLNEGETAGVAHGRVPPAEPSLAPGPVSLLGPDGRLLAVARVEEGGRIRLERVL